MEAQKGRGRRVRKKQVVDSDGWTTVAGSGSAKQDPAEPPGGARPTRVVDGLTVAKLVGELRDMQARWEKTACAKYIDQTLSLRDWSTTEAVCIGIGSFSLDWEHRHRSLWQLVLFLDVVKLRRQSSILILITTNTLLVRLESPAIALYAQEPAFTTLDVSFLNALDITVLSTGIENHIGNLSFVFAPFVDWFILLPLFLKEKDPELYLGNEILDNYAAVANTQDKRKVLSECNELGRRFRSGRERRKMPEFEIHPHALNGLMVYWREEEDEGE